MKSTILDSVLFTKEDALSFGYFIEFELFNTCDNELFEKLSDLYVKLIDDIEDTMGEYTFPDDTIKELVVSINNSGSELFDLLKPFNYNPDVFMLKLDYKNWVTSHENSSKGKYTMGNRFNNNMKLTPKNMSLAVDDLLEMWFVVDNNMKDVLIRSKVEDIDTTIENYAGFCENSFVLIGKLINKNIPDNKRGDVIEFIKEAHDGVLEFVGGKDFKEIHKFEEDKFNPWLEETIKSLLDKAD